MEAPRKVCQSEKDRIMDEAVRGARLVSAGMSPKRVARDPDGKDRPVTPAEIQRAADLREQRARGYAKWRIANYEAGGTATLW